MDYYVITVQDGRFAWLARGPKNAPPSWTQLPPSDGESSAKAFRTQLGAMIAAGRLRKKHSVRAWAVDRTGTLI